MAGLNETNKWETEIYRIEENDPVHGGEDGITNKPIKQLANRTKYLKTEVEKRYIAQNASTEQTGLVQLDSNTDSDAEDKAATPKAVNVVKALVIAVRNALNNYIPNSKKSNADNSSSSDTIATSYALKKYVILQQKEQQIRPLYKQCCHTKPMALINQNPLLSSRLAN